MRKMGVRMPKRPSMEKETKELRAPAQVLTDALPVARTEQGVRSLVESMLEDLGIENAAQNLSFPEAHSDIFEIRGLTTIQVQDFTSSLAEVSIFQFHQADVQSRGDRTMVDIRIVPQAWRARKNHEVFRTIQELGQQSYATR